MIHGLAPHYRSFHVDILDRIVTRRSGICRQNDEVRQHSLRDCSFRLFFISGIGSAYRPDP